MMPFNELLSIICLSASIIKSPPVKRMKRFSLLINYNINSERKEYINFLDKNDLHFGFATFWNANVTTELSHGKIRIAGLEPSGLEPDNRFNIQGWLNPVKYYDPSFHQGESFLLLTRDEWELAKLTGREFSLLKPDYYDSNFIIIRYPSAQIIHNDVLDN